MEECISKSQATTLISSLTDWRKCILCGEIFGEPMTNEHIETEPHRSRIDRYVGGISKFIFMIPSPMYCEIIRCWTPPQLTNDQLVYACAKHTEIEDGLLDARVTSQQPFISATDAVNADTEMSEYMDGFADSFIVPAPSQADGDLSAVIQNSLQDLMGMMGDGGGDFESLLANLNIDSDDNIDDSQ